MFHHDGYKHTTPNEANKSKLNMFILKCVEYHILLYFTLQNFRTFCTAILDWVVVNIFLFPVGFLYLRRPQKCGKGGGGSIWKHLKTKNGAYKLKNMFYK